MICLNTSAALYSLPTIRQSYRKQWSISRPLGFSLNSSWLCLASFRMEVRDGEESRKWKAVKHSVVCAKYGAERKPRRNENLTFHFVTQLKEWEGIVNLQGKGTPKRCKVGVKKDVENCWRDQVRDIWNSRMERREANAGLESKPHQGRETWKGRWLKLEHKKNGWEMSRIEFYFH